MILLILVTTGEYGSVLSIKAITHHLPASLEVKGTIISSPVLVTSFTFPSYFEKLSLSDRPNFGGHFLLID